jgi:hypothetical protein
MSGLTRSWAVPEDEPSAPLFTQRRLVTLGAMALGATLAIVFAVRGAHQPAPVAAAAPPPAAPAKVEAPAPAPAPVEAPAPAVSASASAAPSAAASAPVAAPAPIAPKVAVAPAPRPAPAPVPRRPAAREDAPVETRKTVAAADKVVSRPSSGDLFDDPR